MEWSCSVAHGYGVAGQVATHLLFPDVPMRQSSQPLTDNQPHPSPQRALKYNFALNYR